jgi:hypothetical protein
VRPGRRRGSAARLGTIAPCGGVADVELGAHVAARRACVDEQTRARQDTDRDVAGNRLELDLAGADRAQALVARHRLGGHVAMRLPELEVARDRVRRELAASRADPGIARDGVDPAVAVELVDAHVAAR